MTETLDELCRELRNWFFVDEIDGDYSVSAGSLSPDLGLLPGQYYYISGSIFNDGVHCHPDVDLVDENFHGSVLPMAVPRGFIALAGEIEKYRARLDEIGAADTGYKSESFGGYSYTLSTDAPADVVELRDRIINGKRKWRRIL